jgi:hypothetical protein
MLLPELACVIGLNESIILQQVHYWINQNIKGERNHYNDHYWTYNTYENCQKQFPFWSTITLKKAIANLKKMNLLLTGNFNKKKYDRTIWYTVNYEELAVRLKLPLDYYDSM